MNSMRTRKGGGSCSTTYCSYDNLGSVSYRIYQKYLNSIGANESRDIQVREMPTDEEIMRHIKSDCLSNHGDSVCIGLPYFEKLETTRGKEIYSTTRTYLKKHNFSDILTDVKKRIEEFLSTEKFNNRVIYIEQLKKSGRIAGSGPVKTRKRPKKRITRNF